MAAKKAERNPGKISSDKSPRGSAEFWTGSEQGTSEEGFEEGRNTTNKAAGGAGKAAAGPQ